MKFYITGSNASLLSPELGTRLTGRYLPIELFPFSDANEEGFEIDGMPVEIRSIAEWLVAP